MKRRPLMALLESLHACEDAKDWVREEHKEHKEHKDLSPFEEFSSLWGGCIDWMSQPDVERGYPDLPWDQGYKRAHAEALAEMAREAT